MAGWSEAVEACFERGWTDGLPVVPATEAAVRPFLRAAGLAPGDVVLREPVRRRTITAEKVAVNALLAGCRPEYMPVLLAALDAMADPAFNLHGAITSTGGAAAFVVVNGPIRTRLGFNAGTNVFGPGWRANATVGRALRLVILNCLGAQPGILDKSTQGHPGKFTYCVAEDEEGSPWEPLSVERGFARETSTVTVFAAEGPHNVVSHYGETGETIVVALADTMSALGSFSPGQSFVVLAPEHTSMLARDGWTKRRLREDLYARVRRTRADLKRAGKIPGAVGPGDEEHWLSRGKSPDDIHVMVAGGGAGGHSAFIPAWSRDRNSLAITREIRYPMTRESAHAALDPGSDRRRRRSGSPPRPASARPRRQSAGPSRQRQGQRGPAARLRPRGPGRPLSPPRRRGEGKGQRQPSGRRRRARRAGA